MFSITTALNSCVTFASSSNSACRICLCYNTICTKPIIQPLDPRQRLPSASSYTSPTESQPHEALSPLVKHTLHLDYPSHHSSSYSYGDLVSVRLH